MPSHAYNTLLALTQQLHLWVTPARQTCVQLPSGAVPLWSEDFFTWCYTKLREQLPTAISYNKVLRKLEDQTNPIAELPVRIAVTNNKEHHLDLGGLSIHLTGKQWIIEPSTFSFHRPFTNNPLPEPTQAKRKLHEYLREAFALPESKSPTNDPSLTLAQWLELAMRPGLSCPPLILTGNARDEAADLLRQLIDPAVCPRFPFPTGRRDAADMALHNRVLAFPLYGKISAFKQAIIKELSEGRFSARLRQVDPRGPKRYQQLGRPVILTSNERQQICSNQVEIEINQCRRLPQPEVLAALLDQMVLTLREEAKPATEPPTQAAVSMQPQREITQADPPAP